MRLVLAPPNAHDDDATFPGKAVLAGVKNLGARFPAARLREVAVVRARELDQVADPGGKLRIWLAIESLQVTGSFKVRGALVAVAALQDRARAGSGGNSPSPHVISASAGNHGAGLAYASKVLGVRATVVVPSSAPRAKRDRIAAYGVEVRLASSPHYDDAEAEAVALAKAEAARGEGEVRYLSPYDDTDVVAGNGGSLGYEIVRALRRTPAAVLAPFGGGGLVTGLACALADEAGERLGHDRRVWGAQSEACPAMAQSLEAGRAIVRLESDSTLADGLEGGISVTAFARARQAVAGIVVVTETAIAKAMAYGLRELGLVLEGSAACALAPVLEALPEPLRAGRGGEGGDLVVVLSGRNVDRDVIVRVLSSP